MSGPPRPGHSSLACSSPATMRSRATACSRTSGAGSSGDSSEIALRSTVSRLRKHLRDGGLDRDLVLTRPPGYSLEATDAEVDAARFERPRGRGASALEGGHAVRASALLADALALWRGPAYGQFADDEFARADARRLEELRLAAIEARVDAELALGHHSELIGELETLTGAYPLRERLWGQRMLALYRAGRQAEALRVFQDLRATLVDELGIDPDPEVARLEQDIFAQRPDIAWTAATRATSAATGARRAPGRSPLRARKRRSSGATPSSNASTDGGRRRRRAAPSWSSSASPGSARPACSTSSPTPRTRMVR